MQVLLSTPIYIQPYIYIAIYWVAVLQKNFKEGLIKKNQPGSWFFQTPLATTKLIQCVVNQAQVAQKLSF